MVDLLKKAFLSTEINSTSCLLAYALFFIAGRPLAAQEPLTPEVVRIPTESQAYLAVFIHLAARLPPQNPDGSVRPLCVGIGSSHQTSSDPAPDLMTSIRHAQPRAIPASDCSSDPVSLETLRAGTAPQRIHVGFVARRAGDSFTFNVSVANPLFWEGGVGSCHARRQNDEWQVSCIYM
jgi:hypothetical protein